MSRAVWVLVAVMALAFPVEACCNGLPVRRGPDPTGWVIAEDMDVMVVRERLDFVVAESLDQAEVTAVYSLENSGASSETFTVAFFVSDSDDVKAEFGGMPLRVDRAAPEQALEAFRLVYGAEAQHSVPLVLFDLQIDGHGRGELQVQYTHRAGWDDTSQPNRVHTYMYRLMPINGWRSVGEIDITVVAPARARLVQAESERVRLERQTRASEDEPLGLIYTASLSDQPAEDLLFGLTSERGAWLGKSRKVYNALFWALPALFAGLFSIKTSAIVKFRSIFLNAMAGALVGGIAGGTGAFLGFWFLKTAVPVGVYTNASPLMYVLFLPVLGAFMGAILGPWTLAARGAHHLDRIPGA